MDLSIRDIRRILRLFVVATVVASAGVWADSATAVTPAAAPAAFPNVVVPAPVSEVAASG